MLELLREARNEALADRTAADDFDPFTPHTVLEARAYDPDSEDHQ